MRTVTDPVPEPVSRSESGVAIHADRESPGPELEQILVMILQDSPDFTFK